VFLVGPQARYHLANAPLVQALVQVRFPVSARLATVEGIAPIQQGLRGTYPFMQQLHQMNIQIGPGAAPPGIVGGSAWELRDDDGWAVAIAPDSATLSVGSAYEGVEEFGRRFVEMVQVLCEVEQVPRCDRLGVRYISVAETIPGDDASWRSWFRPELVGWVGNAVVVEPTSVTSAINQVQLSSLPTPVFAGAQAMQALVRHGLVPAGTVIPGAPPVTTGAVSYILDIDVSVEAPQPFSADSLEEQFTELHSQIDRFFRWTLTPNGETHFGLEEVP